MNTLQEAIDNGTLLSGIDVVWLHDSKRLVMEVLTWCRSPMNINGDKVNIEIAAKRSSHFLVLRDRKSTEISIVPSCECVMCGGVYTEEVR